MINEQLISPKSVAIVGASNDLHKPGGKLLKNIVDAGYKGLIYPVNQNNPEVQGLMAYKNIDQLPEVDMGILAIPAKLCPQTIEILASKKNARAFIVISAGFSEESREGKELEERILEIVTKYNCSLIGPNCIGIITDSIRGVFTTPVPKYDPCGCDLISGSGATAVFIMESGIQKGLTFANVFSVGNSTQTGIEEVLQYMDDTFHVCESPRVKLLYIESIKNPDKLLKHASSLIRKGCKIAAIKAGKSKEGSRAASSHTGALASSDSAVEALFRKAGIVRCTGREELTTVASVLMHKELRGKKIAIITHAGGPAVMLTDALSEGGLEIPEVKLEKQSELQRILFPGAATSNPIDLLATGTAEQLGQVIDFCDQNFDEVNAMMVIFGSSGLRQVYDAYEVLHAKMQECKKPIFPVLPSVVSAHDELEFFISKGHSNFPDEVQLAKALTLVYNTPQPAEEKIFLEQIDIAGTRKIIEQAQSGYLSPDQIVALLKAGSIPVVNEGIVRSKRKLLSYAEEFGYPLVLKVLGPVHKTDVGGVVLDIRTEKHLVAEYLRLRKIKGSTGVLIQPMISGAELFIGAKYEPRFGHVVVCGLGGIFVEVIQDISSGLAPLTFEEALSMIRSLKSYKIIKGTRGQQSINERKLAEIIVRLSSILRFATEITEIDLNPLIAKGDEIYVVDSRVVIKH